MTTTHLLYLHGFRSSPQSQKARQVAARVAARHPQVTWWCPQLPASPAQAMAELLAGVGRWPRAHMVVIGSSLGGFYASHVAHQTGCRRVLLNPAAHPARDLRHYIGEHPAWHNPAERVFFSESHVAELQALAHPAAHTPDNCLAILAKGDELLDWREMQAFCHGARIRLLEGSDHALSDFDLYLDEVFDFLQLA